MQLLAAASDLWEESDSSGCDGVFGCFQPRDILRFIHKSGNVMNSFEENQRWVCKLMDILEQSSVVGRVIDQS